MRRQGSLTLFRLLLILATLCHTGFSLVCYNCPNLTSDCHTNTTCPPNLDSCLIARADGGTRIYHQCWKLDNCSFEVLAVLLQESQLVFKCCQKDLCNDSISGTATFSGKTVLLVISLLAAAWNLHP